MQLDELRIRAMDGSVLVDGQFTLQGHSSVLVHFAIPQLAATAVRLVPRLNYSWSLLGFTRIERGSDGLYAASAPAVTLELTDAVPSLKALAGQYLPQGRTGYSLARKGEVRLGSVNVPLAHPEPDKSPSCYLQFDQLNLDIDASPDGLRISIVARVASLIGPLEGLDVTGLLLHADLFVPAQALELRSLPMLAGRGDDPEVGRASGGRLEPSDLGISRHGGLVVEGRVDWGQSGDRFSPQGPFVALGLFERRMGLAPANEVIRHASGALQPLYGRNSGPRLQVNLGIEDFARMLEFEDQATLSLQGAGIGFIEGRTGRGAYEEGPLRQDLAWLTFKLNRSATGLLIEGTGEFLPGQRRQSPEVGKELDFALVLPRKLILARGLNIPRCWDDWKRDLPGSGVW